ncbi:hypothetical protein SAMN05421690_100164 [Nitrosomonas sp. Nm51]|nr:hypothetical protein SAMN05421690_100164 [Nitrosomonas sp. Nm51]
MLIAANLLKLKPKHFYWEPAFNMLFKYSAYQQSRQKKFSGHVRQRDCCLAVVVDADVNSPLTGILPVRHIKM